VERPPRIIEYICLTCGTQGSVHTEAANGDPTIDGGSPPRCPRCDGTVLYLERKEAAEVYHEAQPVDKA